MSYGAHNRVEVLHGVNLDMLGRRDPEHYGTTDAGRAARRRSSASASELDLEVAFFQTNNEGEYVERLHRLPEVADAAVLNPGAWTHYSYAIRDALEIAGAAGGRGPPLRRRRARGRGGSSRSSTGWSSAPSPARAPTATATRWSCSREELGGVSADRVARAPRRRWSPSEGSTS